MLTSCASSITVCVVGRRWPLRLGVGQRLEHGGLSHEAAGLQSLAHLLEDLPQHHSSGFRQTSAAAEALDVPIRLPGTELPRIDNLVPFRSQEHRPELVIAGLRCLSQQRVDVLLRHKPHGAKMRLVQADAEVAHRVDFEPPPPHAVRYQSAACTTGLTAPLGGLPREL